MNRLSDDKKEEYEVIEYDQISAPIWVIHKNCGNKFKMGGYKFLNGLGCPKCYGVNSKSTEIIKSEVKKIWGNDFEVLGEYTLDRAKIKVKHKCGYIYDVRPSSLLSGNGCIKCQESKGERAVSKCLDSMNIRYEIEHKFDDCKYRNKLPFDFYIPEYNLCIEYQGEQHYMVVNYRGGNKKFNENQIRDNIKREYCRHNNIELLEIPYWDYDNVEKILHKRFV